MATRDARPPAAAHREIGRDAVQISCPVGVMPVTINGDAATAPTTTGLPSAAERADCP